jgi:hypothetical protein
MAETQRGIAIMKLREQIGRVITTLEATKEDWVETINIRQIEVAKELLNQAHKLLGNLALRPVEEEEEEELETLGGEEEGEEF